MDPVAVARADRHGGAVQAVSDRALADPEFLRELQTRYALDVPGNDVGERESRVLSARPDGHARRSEASEDRGGPDALRARQRFGARSRGVALDEIVEVDLNVSWQGWAYDFETQGRAYFADSLLESNCVRAFAPNVDTGSGQLSDELPADSPEAAAGVP
jgi:hypothetical protein